MATVVVRRHGGRTVVVRHRGSRTVAALREAADAIARTHRAGGAVVVVVSASGDTVSELLGSAASVSAVWPARELDQLYATAGTTAAALLAMALHDLGVPAVALDGTQAGIAAVGPHGGGTVAAVRTTRIRRLLAEGNVVVVAGAQGFTADGDIVTLGRGGSDVTADVLVAALGADGIGDGAIGNDTAGKPTEGIRHEHVIRTPAAAGADVPSWRATPVRRPARPLAHRRSGGA